MATLQPGQRTMTARYDSRCCMCNNRIQAGSEIIYDSMVHGTKHLDCKATQTIDASVAITPEIQDAIEDYLSNNINRTVLLAFAQSRGVSGPSINRAIETARQER